MRRAHTAENVAPAIKTLLAQIDAAYPARRRTTEGHDSDGIWPSPQHTAANPDSDHEAGNALDIDDDLSGVDGRPPMVTPAMARALSTHRACKYTIHDGRIYRGGSSAPYTGSNPHTGHVHISVWEDRRDDKTPWDLGEEEDVLDYYIIPIVCETEAHLAAAKARCAALGIKAVSCGNALYAHANKEKGEKLQAWVKATPGVGSLKGVPTTAETAAAMGVVKQVPIPSCGSLADDLAEAEAKIARAREALS